MGGAQPDLGAQAEALRERLGPFGVWHFATGLQPAAVERDFAARVEDLGFGALWFGEAPPTKEAFTHAALLLGGDEAHHRRDRHRQHLGA